MKTQYWIHKRVVVVVGEALSKKNVILCLQSRVRSSDSNSDR